MRRVIVFMSIVVIVLCCSCGGGSSTSTTTTTQQREVTPSSIVVTPSSATVAVGGVLQFLATVQGIANTTVLWSIQEGAAGGTIEANGKYTAPMAVGMYHVTAQAAANPSLLATATVRVTTPGEAQGVYSGTFSPEFYSSAFYAIILPNDMFYATWDSGTEFPGPGFMVGQGTSAAGTYTAVLTNYFWDSGVTSPLTATYVPGVSLNGSVTLSNGFTYKINGTAVPSSQFNYNTPANLANIVGVWPAPYNITITASGTITLMGSCSYSGTITPDPNKNFFTVNLTAGGAPCVYPNQTASGVAVETLLPDGITRQLWIGAAAGNWYISVSAQR